MIHLLHGHDTFSSAARLRALRLALDPTGFNAVSLDAQEADLAALRAACDALPFFGGGRYVEARGLLSRWGGRGKEKAQGDGEALAALARYLPAMPPTTTLALWEPGPVEPPAPLRRALQELGAVIERFEAPRGRALRDWVIAQAREVGATIRPDAAEALLDAACPQGWREAPRGREGAAPDLQRLDSELRKLATAILSRRGEAGRTIAARDVAALVVGGPESNVFDLVNAIADGSAPLALARLRAALDDGIAPELILSLLAGQFSTLARVRAAGGARAGEATLARRLGLPPYRVGRAARQLGQMGEARVARCLAIVLEADEALKTGHAPRGEDALYWAVLELCRVGPPGPPLIQPAVG